MNDFRPRFVPKRNQLRTTVERVSNCGVSIQLLAGGVGSSGFEIELAFAFLVENAVAAGAAAADVERLDRINGIKMD
jgi:hypothetical protein